MEYIRIPRTDLEVSRIALGTWTMGGWMWGGTDEKQAINTIHAALEKGVNLIDTAPVYGFGLSEEIVGKALAQKKCRDRVFISTKTGLDWKDGKVFRNCSPDFIKRNFADSLKNLQTDYVDILFVHWPDPLEPFEETARVLNQFLKEGQIRAVGVSNYSPEQIQAFQRGGPVHVVQPPYNLFEREIGGRMPPVRREDRRRRGRVAGHELFVDRDASSLGDVLANPASSVAPSPGQRGCDARPFAD